MAAWKKPFLPPSISSAQIYPNLGLVQSLSVSTGGGPSYLRNSHTLQRVPENSEVDLDASRSRRSPGRTSPCRQVSHAQTLPVTSNYQQVRAAGRGEDWNNLQRCILDLFRHSEPSLAPGELTILHKNIRKLLESKTGPFLYDYYKQELLTKGMIILREEVKKHNGEELLKVLGETWDTFFTKILPYMEAIMYPVKTKRAQAIRATALLAFRDVVALKVKLDVALTNIQSAVNPSIKHMLLVLQNVNDVFPPNKNKLLFEQLVAMVIIPYMGFNGLYQGGPEPVIVSSEPSMVARKKSTDLTLCRRVSRPLSVQPRQLENLNDLFLMAIRKQQASSFAR